MSKHELTSAIKYDKLVAFGFTLNEGIYTYQVELGRTELVLAVTIRTTGELVKLVFDQATGEEYVLHHTLNAQGSFVGQVRAEYEKELKKIETYCFDCQTETYEQKQSQELVSLIEKNYEDRIEFLWKRTPKNGIFRRQDTKKWYVAILAVEKGKLGVTGEGTIEIIDLRGEPAVISQLVDHRRYYPGYHMNKKHWYTICLDGSVSTAELLERIKISYDLANK